MPISASRRYKWLEIEPIISLVLVVGVFGFLFGYFLGAILRWPGS